MSLGSEDGLQDGTIDGQLGTLDGRLDGRAYGSSDGSYVGIPASTGSLVGLGTVGHNVGSRITKVGLFDGKKEGSTEGNELDGTKDGDELVGTCDGSDNVGSFDGNSVGSMTNVMVGFADG